VPFLMPRITPTKGSRTSADGHRPFLIRTRPNSLVSAALWLASGTRASLVEITVADPTLHRTLPVVRSSDMSRNYKSLRTQLTAGAPAIRRLQAYGELSHMACRRRVPTQRPAFNTDGSEIGAQDMFLSVASCSYVLRNLRLPKNASEPGRALPPCGWPP
jgi:hypothetical protein